MRAFCLTGFVGICTTGAGFFPFGGAVASAQALLALQAFVRDRLPLFGRYQDAMWPGDPWLYHAHLSAGSR